ncbi:PREDICTED: ATP-dependent Clp protease ATP-binding subunit CLPT1, chloroplastic-like [Camelina sativa]|uniref:ATP-dependent Clp protease ATP-binding subunit CLPT1, chloroplastic-like n=1 Tax=Camelina sativa TaxID=90675 RepID=A0ABM1QHI5_CAMSA|nr:PREDICTED: ATP-dependent Clp protease ATP-binding subunit CLPT1, chloroplastic-like [Camelina sativa]
MASYTLSFIPLTLSNPRILVSRQIGSFSSSSRIPLTSSLLGKKLLVTQPSRHSFVSKHRCLTSASTVLNVPTAQPENGSSDKIPRWSARAIKSLAMGELEARKLKYPSTGTEAILMGILVEGLCPEHPPLTEPAQKAIAWAIDEKNKSAVDGELTTAYLLLGIWSQKDSAARQILEKLGFNEDKAKEVEKSMNEDVDLSFKKQGQ